MASSKGRVYSLREVQLIFEADSGSDSGESDIEVEVNIRVGEIMESFFV